MAGGGIEDETAASADDDPISRDPIGVLATAAGYDDGESWWSDVIEENPASGPVFAAVADAMTALRAESKPLSPREAAREAHMRIEIAEDREGMRGRDRGGVRGLACAGTFGASQPRGRPRIAQGAAEGEDQGDLGAVDRAAAGAVERLWRGRGRARLVRASVGDARRRRSRRGVAGQGRVCAA